MSEFSRTCFHEASSIKAFSGLLMPEPSSLLKLEPVRWQVITRFNAVVRGGLLAPIAEHWIFGAVVGCHSHVIHDLELISTGRETRCRMYRFLEPTVKVSFLG